MGGISSSIGLISGIDTASLIEQLLAIQARPREQVQVRVANLRAQQTALLDINSRLNIFQNTAAALPHRRRVQCDPRHHE